MPRSKLTLKIILIDSEVDDFCASVHVLYGAATLRNMEQFVKDTLKTGASLSGFKVKKHNTRHVEPSKVEA